MILGTRCPKGRDVGKRKAAHGRRCVQRTTAQIQDLRAHRKKLLEKGWRKQDRWAERGGAAVSYPARYERRISCEISKISSQTRSRVVHSRQASINASINELVEETEAGWSSAPACPGWRRTGDDLFCGGSLMRGGNTMQAHPQHNLKWTAQFLVPGEFLIITAYQLVR